jgi:hypothetical protein
MRRVAADRVTSTVDPDARHGSKTTSAKIVGYKVHRSRLGNQGLLIPDVDVGHAGLGS